jgi:hypothetical protein
MIALPAIVHARFRYWGLDVPCILAGGLCLQRAVTQRLECHSGGIRKAIRFAKPEVFGSYEAIFPILSRPKSARTRFFPFLGYKPGPTMLQVVDSR